MNQTPSPSSPDSSLPVLVFLIGLRGSGKSTIGRLIANRLKRPFVDLDDEVLAMFKEGSVTEVWETHGEAAWRRAETDATRAIMRSPSGQIVAMGGGAAMVPGIAGGLAEAAEHGLAIVIYLRAMPETLRRRLATDVGDRPSLTGQGVVDEIDAVFAARDPVYRSLAMTILDIDALDENATVDEVETVLAS